MPNCCGSRQRLDSIAQLHHKVLYFMLQFEKDINRSCMLYSVLDVFLLPSILNRACVSYIYEGKDAFLWLPTSFGKSICYEVLPFVFDVKLCPVGSLVVVVLLFLSLTIDKFIARGLVELEQAAVMYYLLRYCTRSQFLQCHIHIFHID